MCPSGTNINDAMLMAVKLLDTSNQAELLPSGSVSLIILLTDGEPTAGKDTWSKAATASGLAVKPGAGRRGIPLALKFQKYPLSK